MTKEEYRIALLSSIVTSIAYGAIVAWLIVMWSLLICTPSHSTVNFDRLLICVAQVETGHIAESQRDTVVSKCGAIGRYQIMPFHAKGHGYKVKDLYNPKVNRLIAHKLLVGYYHKYGNLSQVLAAYNGGGRQARIINNNQRCRETRYYVKAVLKLYKGG